MEEEYNLARDLGLTRNNFYHGSFLHEMITNTNTKLMFAATKSEKASFCTVRSHFLFTMKAFELRGENRKLACEAGYPTLKDGYLDIDLSQFGLAPTERMMWEYPKTDPWSIFKLSYPANEDIPFIVNCLELREDKKFGRNIVTNQGKRPTLNSAYCSF